MFVRSLIKVSKVKFSDFKFIFIYRNKFNNDVFNLLNNVTATKSEYKSPK